MLRFCAGFSHGISRPIIQPALSKDILVNYKNNISASSNIISRRIFTKNVSQVNEENNLERVYYGPLTPQIKAVKVFSISSSAAGLVAQPIIIREAATIGSTSLLIAICSVVGFFTFITPLLLHLVTKKYVTEIHYDPTKSTYKASTINFFLREKQLEFTPNDVHVPDLPGMFTTLNAKGKPLFIEARFFNDPSHYAKIMGYDKPMDFKLGNQQAADTSPKP